MNSDKCQYLMINGSRAGQICGRKTTEGNFCDRCICREEAQVILQSYSGLKLNVKCEHHDPYNCDDETCQNSGCHCNRPVVFKGYCFLCLNAN